MVDELRSGQPLGSVSLLGGVRIAAAKPSAGLLKGQLLRYLAEIAWAPDAVLVNGHLDWSETDDGRFLVSARVDEVEGRVFISLNDDGFIGQIDADDRPRQEGARMVERPWRGRFRNFQRVDGRALPHAADVSWMVDGVYDCVWEGALTSWKLSR